MKDFKRLQVKDFSCSSNSAGGRGLFFFILQQKKLNTGLTSTVQLSLFELNKLTDTLADTLGVLVWFLFALAEAELLWLCWALPALVLLIELWEVIAGASGSCWGKQLMNYRGLFPSLTNA